MAPNLNEPQTIIFKWAHNNNIDPGGPGPFNLIFANQFKIVVVITFYSPSCLGQETAKEPFGLRVKLPPVHLSTTHDGGFTLSL